MADVAATTLTCPLIALFPESEGGDSELGPLIRRAGISSLGQVSEWPSSAFITHLRT